MTQAQGPKHGGPPAERRELCLWRDSFLRCNRPQVCREQVSGCPSSLTENVMAPNTLRRQEYGCRVNIWRERLEVRGGWWVAEPGSE